MLPQELFNCYITRTSVGKLTVIQNILFRYFFREAFCKRFFISLAELRKYAKDIKTSAITYVMADVFYEGDGKIKKIKKSFTVH